MSLLVLSANDVSVISSTFTSNALTSLMALVFARLRVPENAAVPHRTAISTDTYNTLFMPAQVPGFGTAIKIVSIPSPSSGNLKKGGIPATTVILDEQTGAAKAVINARSLTALRTAAGEWRF
ncbi:hypothetical protein EW145_g4409 [Phellinidium pouzarii]|uniref:Uncharacterized protein n=1 Tax=Phellinidium pouzarii TaxID=167371 RepID=A0A4S4L3S7_9AGAM|nr:hypothetical protein EW145_g4409 [Phellinidium pouzarii]